MVQTVIFIFALAISVISPIIALPLPSGSDLHFANDWLEKYNDLVNEDLLAGPSSSSSRPPTPTIPSNLPLNPTHSLPSSEFTSAVAHIPHQIGSGSSQHDLHANFPVQDQNPNHPPTSPNPGFTFSYNPHQFSPPQFPPHSGSVRPGQHLNANFAGNSQDHRQPPPMGSGSNQRHDGGQATHGTPVGQSKYSGLVNEDLLASQSSRRPLTLAPTIPSSPSLNPTTHSLPNREFTFVVPHSPPAHQIGFGLPQHDLLANFPFQDQNPKHPPTYPNPPTHPFPNSGFFSHNPHQFPPPQFSPYSGSVWPAQHLNENVAVNSQGHRQPPPMGSGRIQYHDSGQTTQASVGQSQGLKRKETIPSQAEAGPARKRQKRSDPNEYRITPITHLLPPPGHPTQQSQANLETPHSEQVVKTPGRRPDEDTCPIGGCKEPLSGLKQKDHHMKTVHPTINYGCPHPGPTCQLKTYPSRRALEEHQRKIKKNEPGHQGPPRYVDTAASTAASGSGSRA